MTIRAGNFIGQLTTAQITNLPEEDRRTKNFVYDTVTGELRAYATDGEAFPSLVWATTGAGVPMLDGSGNPDGLVVGLYGQDYRDTDVDIIYKCISDPSGTDWVVT